MQTIQNEYDDTFKRTDYLEVLASETDVSMVFEDFFSDDLETVESAILNVNKLQNSTNMIVSLAVYHIIEHGLYLTSARTPSEYFRNAAGKLNMSRQLVSKYYKSSAAFHRYRTGLISAKFKANKDFGKLYLLEKAVDKFGLDAVKLLPKMTFSDYYDYAMDMKQLDYTDPKVQNIEIEITPDGFYLDGKMILDVRDVKKIVAEGSEPFLIGVYSKGEKVAIGRFLDEFRSKK